MNSGEKSKIQQQEIIIDIHIKTLKFKVDTKTPVRVIWSRGKKQAKTQVKSLNSGIETAVFDEKFQINTVLEIDEKTEMPIKEKISKLTVCLDKSLGGTELGTAEVDMGNYSYGQYNLIKLNLEQCPSNTDYPFDPSETVLEVGLKGTRADGLVQKRMSAIKQ
jgi:hypothetical protein